MTSPERQIQVKKPIPSRLIIALAAIVYCIPSNPQAILPGAPLGIMGGAVLIALIAGAIAVNRPVRRARLWLAALAVVAIARWTSGAYAPDFGWSAAYIASDDPTRPIERSTELAQPNATRIDRALDFDAAGFPVHFFNDIRRFNYYRPTDIARDTMPFSVTWSGILIERSARAQSLLLVTNGPAELQIGSQQQVQFPATEVAREYEISIGSLTSGSPITISYTRLFEVNPILRLAWVDADGTRWPVGAPEIAASASDAARSWLGSLTQWIGTFTSLGLLALIAGAFARGSLSPWERARVREAGTPPITNPHPNPPPGGEGASRWQTWERVFIALVLLWAAIEPIASWLPFDRDAILLSGGNDWLAYESFARDIQLNGLLMNNGRPPGTGDAYYYQPAYSYVLAIVHQLLGESLGPVLWWQHASIGFAAALVYGLARRLGGPIAGVCAALLVMAFRPLELFAVSGLLLSENLLFLVLPGMLWLFVRAYQQPSLASWAWAGAALGLAGLTRSTPLLVLPFALLGIVISTRRLAGWRQVMLTLAIFLIACFGVVGMATIRNTIVSNKPTLITTSAGANLIEAHRPTDKVDMKGIDQNPVYERLGLDRQTREVAEFIRQDPQGYLATLWPTAAYAIGYVEPILPERGIEWPLLISSAAYLALTSIIPATRRNGAWLIHAFILTHWLQTALFFSHQYGFRLPLPMYLSMFAVIGVALAALVGLANRGARSTTPVGVTRFAWSGLVALAAFAVASIASGSGAALEGAATRLYTLEGDVARIATAVRNLPDDQRPNWAYGTGDDRRTREIAYLRGLAFPLIKWVDTDRGMVFPAVGQTAILGAVDDRPPGRFSECLHAGTQSNEATLYQVDSPRTSGCLDLTRPAEIEFEHLSRIIGSSAPSSIRAGERFTSVVTWEAVERPPARYRPLLELVGPDDRPVAGAESNPYGTDLWSSGELISSIHEVSIEPNVAPGQYTLALSFAGGSPRPNLADSSALHFRAPLGTMSVEAPSQPVQPSQLGIPPRSPWTVGSLQLVGASSSPASARPGDPIEVALAWQSTQSSPEGVNLVMELVGPAQSTVISQLVPLDGRWPLNRWRRGDSVADLRTIVIPNDLPDGSYQLRIRDTDRPEASVDVGAITVEPRQRRMQPLDVRAASEATLESSYRLVGYDLRNRRPDPGDTVELGLTWQAVAPPSSRHLIVISLVHADTNRVAIRRETEPSDGSRPTTGWSNGEYVVDNHRVRTSRDLPPGHYRVRIDLVERDSGRYLLDANGSTGILLPPEVVVD